MARRRGISHRRKHRYLYDGGGDINRVEYDPGKDFYEAENHRD